MELWKLREQAKDGISYRRGPKELREMCAFFGAQCRKRGLIYSYRDTFYVADKERERKTFPEYQMKKHDKLSFKDELRTYIRLAMNSRNTKNIDDVVEELRSIYRINVRLKGNTISYGPLIELVAILKKCPDDNTREKMKVSMFNNLLMKPETVTSAKEVHDIVRQDGAVKFILK